MKRPPIPPRRRSGGLKFGDKPYLLEALQTMAARLPEPAMLRPDLGTLRGQALLDAVEGLEADGVLVARSKVLRCPWYVEDQVLAELAAAGLPRRRAGSLCE